MNKKNIIQFLPYFPPHKGGLETVSEELSFFYVSKGYGEVINIVFDISRFNPQVLGKDINEVKKILLNGKFIGYEQKGYSVYFLPAFEIIPNFPVPKFWEKGFWEVFKTVTRSVSLSTQVTSIDAKKWIIQTHTRFFLSSLLGGLFAKYHKLKWVHIEHGSDYVKLGSKWKTKFSYLYDRIVGKWIFNKADKIVAISEGVKDFIQKEFINREVYVIHNGIDFIPHTKVGNLEKIQIGFVGRIVKLKGLELLITVFNNLEKKYPNIFLEIVGDGEERKNLEYQKTEKIKFLGLQDRDYVKGFLAKTDILVNPSFQEGLPTIVMEGLLSQCVVVATDVGGTKEISTHDDLIIVEKGNILSLENGIEKAILDYKKLSGMSFESVRKRFDWDKNIEKYFSLYSSFNDK